MTSTLKTMCTQKFNQFQLKLGQDWQKRIVTYRAIFTGWSPIIVFCITCALTTYTCAFSITYKLKVKCNVSHMEYTFLTDIHL